MGMLFMGFALGLLVGVVAGMALMVWLHPGC